jgi:porin
MAFQKETVLRGVAAVLIPSDTIESTVTNEHSFADASQNEKPSQSGSAEVEESKGEPSSQTTFGDFGGGRSWLSEHGVTLGLAYKADYWSGISGGIDRGRSFLDNIDYEIAVDAERLMGWSGTAFFISFLTNHGGNPSDHAGDAQGLSNIAAYNTTKLYQAWVESRMFEERLSILVGLYDLNSEFYVTNTSGLFLHSAQGVGTEFAQTGLNGPSIFPTTSLGLRLRCRATDEVSIQGVILDGVPGNPDEPWGTHVQWQNEDGLLVTAEAAYTKGGGEDSHERYTKFGLGAWSYSGSFDDLVDVDDSGLPIKRSDNRGAYVLAEADVFRDGGEGSRGLAVFARFGIANSAINQFGSCLTGGFVFTGLIPGRVDDLCGAAFSRATNGSPFMRVMENMGTPMANSELAVELTYHAAFTSWLAVQPDLQYIKNPGTDLANAYALLFGVRLELSI